MYEIPFIKFANDAEKMRCIPKPKIQKNFMVNCLQSDDWQVRYSQESAAWSGYFAFREYRMGKYCTAVYLWKR